MLTNGVLRYVAGLPLGAVFALGSVTADGSEVPLDRVAAVAIAVGSVLSAVGWWLVLRRSREVSVWSFGLVGVAATAVLAAPNGVTLVVASVTPLAVATLGRLLADPGPAPVRVVAGLVGLVVAVPAALFALVAGRLVAVLEQFGDGIAMERLTATVGAALVAALTEVAIVVSAGLVLRLSGPRSGPHHG